MEIIYTIGHSNITVKKFLDLLNANSIQLVMDVRSSPYSRYVPQYNREAFQKELERVGIFYRYAGDFLGGRPQDPSCYKEGLIPDGSADYLNLVDYLSVMEKEFFQKGIQQLLNLSEKQRVAVMCSEEDPAKCHRHHLIGRYLVGQGVKVVHIRSNGSLVGDQSLPNLIEEQPWVQDSLL